MQTKRRDTLSLLLDVQRSRLRLRLLERKLARDMRKHRVTLASVLAGHDTLRKASNVFSRTQE